MVAGWSKTKIKQQKTSCQNWISHEIPVEFLQARDLEILRSPYRHTFIGKCLLKFSCGFLRAGFPSFLLLWSCAESRRCLVERESHTNCFQMCQTTQLQLWLTFLPLQLILIREKIPEGGKALPGETSETVLNSNYIFAEIFVFSCLVHSRAYQFTSIVKP